MDMPERTAGAMKDSEAFPKVCGLDLSLTGTGVASTLGWTHLIGRQGITTQPLIDRYAALTYLAHDIADYAQGADLVVIEALTFNRVDGGRGGAGERAGLYWYVIRRLLHADTLVAEVPPASLKRYATGKGSARKGEVVDAVARRWPQFETRGDDNVCDAVVLAAMGADHLGQPLTRMPAAHREALKAVTWPDRTVLTTGMDH